MLESTLTVIPFLFRAVHLLLSIASSSNAMVSLFFFVLCALMYIRERINEEERERSRFDELKEVVFPLEDQ